MKFLLDTHVLLWWCQASKELPQSHAQVLHHPQSGQPFYVSGISLWEIATLYDLKRIRLMLPLGEWLERAVAPPLVQCCSISPAIAAEVASLPSSFHRDPADRIIVATSRILGATLLTVDQRIIQSEIVPTLS